MRGTIHLVSARDYWPFAVGIRRARRLWWLGVRRPHSERVDLAAANAALRELVRGTTRSRAEIVACLREFDPHGAPAGTAWSGVDVELVRAPPSGTWAKRRAHTFALAEDWLGPAAVDEHEGLEHLARRYLAAFGPATRDDLASWAGVPVKFFDPVLERHEPAPLPRRGRQRAARRARAHRSPIPTRPRRFASCRRGTRRCSSTRGAPASSPSVTGRASSTRRRRNRSGRSSSTAPSRARGASTAAASAPSRSSGCRARRASSCARRPSASPRSTPSF